MGVKGTCLTSLCIRDHGSLASCCTSSSRFLWENSTSSVFGATHGLRGAKDHTADIEGVAAAGGGVGGDVAADDGAVAAASSASVSAAAAASAEATDDELGESSIVNCGLRKFSLCGRGSWEDGVGETTCCEPPADCGVSGERVSELKLTSIGKSKRFWISGGVLGRRSAVTGEEGVTSAAAGACGPAWTWAAVVVMTGATGAAAAAAAAAG